MELTALGAPPRCCPARAAGASIGQSAAPALQGSQAAPPPGRLSLGGGAGGGALAQQARPICKSRRLRPPLAAPEVSRKETAALQPVGRRREPERRVTGAEERRGLGQGPARECR